MGDRLGRLTSPATLERATRRAGGWWNFRGRHLFVDRRRRAPRMALMLAGYKPELWDVTIARLARFAPDDLDVCLVSPARRPPELMALAEERGWSFLSTEANHVALAQNLAIRAHPDARHVFKLDEDIVLGEGFFERLLAGYERIDEEGTWKPGFVAPVLNVNGFSYVEFLRTLGLEDAWRERFGPARHAADGIPITDDGDAALWIWRHSVPFDEVAARFAAKPFAASAVPHRFSIGAILFARDLWERMGGMLVRPPQGSLGVDEKHICRKCHDFSRPMLVAHDVLAGHYAYGPQSAVMMAALDELRPGLVPPVGPPADTRLAAR